MRLFGLLFLLTVVPASAGESVVLASGSRMHVDRHEVGGLTIRLYSGEGYIEMRASDVRGFETDEPVASAEAVAPPAAAAPEAPAAVPAAATPEQLADAAADKYGLPRKLVRSVMAAESGFQTRAVSPKGAIGLMQLMPSTAQLLGVDPKDPVQNVDAGTRYLHDLLIQYDGMLWHALAAYNAGPGAVEKYKGLPPYAETINYIRRIDRDFRKAD